MGGIGRHQILYRQARTKHKEQERRKKAAVDAGTKKKASRSKRRSIDLTRVPEKRQEWQVRGEIRLVCTLCSFSPTISSLIIQSLFSQVHIKTLTGREFDVIVNPYDDIEDLRIKIGLKEDCSFDQIILISEGGRILHDGDTLMDWHIGQGSTVFMNFRLRGG
jgi:hypothetical protein